MNALQRRGRVAAAVGGLVAVGAATVMVLAGTASAAEQGRCTDNVNVRSQPSASASVVTVCRRGTEVTLGERRNGFVQLTNLNGWAAEQYVSGGTSTAPRTTAPSSRAAAPTTTTKAAAPTSARSEHTAPTSSAAAPRATQAAPAPTTTSSARPAPAAGGSAPADAAPAVRDDAPADAAPAGGDGAPSGPLGSLLG